MDSSENRLFMLHKYTKNSNIYAIKEEARGKLLWLFSLFCGKLVLQNLLH